MTLDHPIPDHELPTIRCNGCGRFLGKGEVKSGVVVLYCGRTPECKGRWTMVMGEEEEKHLTGEDLLVMIGPH